jgi:gentisate 1,2-dioxygenase
MQPYWHQNTGDDLLRAFDLFQRRATRHDECALCRRKSAAGQIVAHEQLSEDDKKRRNSPFGSFPLNEDGAWLMPYEILINPPSVQSPALHWPWADVKAHLDKLEALGKDYVGRRLYLLYNPMTGRTNGTTPNFFATMTIRPPKIVDRPHRHTSAAINYYFHGTGRSTVEGKVYQWKAGDLMLSAPGWAVHNPRLARRLRL